MTRFKLQNVRTKYVGMRVNVNDISVCSFFLSGSAVSRTQQGREPSIKTLRSPYVCS